MKKRVMHSNNDSIEIMIYDKPDEVSQDVFESLVFRYYTGLKNSMKVSDLIFDWVNFWHYKC